MTLSKRTLSVQEAPRNLMELATKSRSARGAPLGRQPIASWRPLLSPCLLDMLSAPDPYCPVIRGDKRALTIRMAEARELPKLESACTTIVMGRG